jgi:hypothetical protein
MPTAYAPRALEAERAVYNETGKTYRLLPDARLKAAKKAPSLAFSGFLPGRFPVPFCSFRSTIVYSISDLQCIPPEGAIH